MMLKLNNRIQLLGSIKECIHKDGELTKIAKRKKSISTQKSQQILLLIFISLINGKL